MSAVLPEGEWRRLDPRKLLLDPIKVVGQALIPVLAVLIGLSSSDNPTLRLLLLPAVVAGALLLGAVPWFTTWYRLEGDTFQLRRGLVSKSTSTASLERIRSVDLEATLLHRVLGLSKVLIGTGVDDERLELDAVTVPHAEELRRALLTRRAAVTGTVDEAVDEMLDEAPAPPEPEQVLARIDWTWLRFAPFSLSRLVIVAGALGALSQFADDLPFLDSEHLGAAWSWVTGFALAVVAAVAAVAALLGWLAISVLGYVAQWWNLRLARQSGSLHLTSGLLTTRSISVEERRVRGVELQEPLLLRLVGGAELSTLATGVGSGGQTRILPPCPHEVAAGVAAEVLEDERPVRVPLTPHGPSARRRCHVRRQWFTLALLSGSVVLLATGLPDPMRGWLPVWLPLAVTAVVGALGVAVAEAEYAHLGHVLADRHLAAGSGALSRVRTVLETDGIIGWVIRETFFQRRLGLADLVATTAAGAERVVVRDVPRGHAVALADRAVPGMLTPFLAD